MNTYIYKKLQGPIFVQEYEAKKKRKEKQINIKINQFSRNLQKLVYIRMQ